MAEPCSWLSRSRGWTPLHSVMAVKTAIHVSFGDLSERVLARRCTAKISKRGMQVGNGVDGRLRGHDVYEG